MSRFTLDPDATLDFSFDWTAWLEDDETISDHEIVADGVTVDSSDEDSGIVTVWLSDAQRGERLVVCRVTTSEGRVDDRTLTLSVVDR